MTPNEIRFEYGAPQLYTYQVPCHENDSIIGYEGDVLVVAYFLHRSHEASCSIRIWYL